MDISIYCDESCHLPNDKQKAMVLGALWCPKKLVPRFNSEIAEIKRKHNLSRYFEIKWTKISPGKSEFYKELIEYFFQNQDLNFRAWIVPNKTILDHDEHRQTHDDWYYKMHFYLIRNLIIPGNGHFIYLDVKDTRSRKKTAKLCEILQNANYDYSHEIVRKIQNLHSHDVGLMQINDMLIGAISYVVRGLNGSEAKNSIIALIKEKSGLKLTQKTLPGEKKFNLYFWHDKDYEND